MRSPRRNGPSADADADPDAATSADAGPSKTRRKHASHDLQALGESLLEFSDARLESIALPEPLVDALRQMQRTRSHEGRRRQMQLIGKLMRNAGDDAIAAARTAVAERELGRAHDALALHAAERWRAELIGSDDATTRFAAAHAGADLQQLRALVRNARKDAAKTPEERSGRAFRELFRFIREHEARG